eukprot:TRINITY_DN60904_c0_g1_i1.p1 TRINITY_DN60904_c0_g1~~TRINITY_DN60904_c0_g1_i1.p1  ORF type:complete len:406 (+),score=179.34 TRINITY_DN60904_c0_g1_i1:76-1293(+)
MPGKKKAEDEKPGPWALGRFSTNLKVGLVGLPNVGKSTLYNCLSHSKHAEAANFPFCTIEPNETRVFLDDARFDFLVDMHKPKSEVRPFLTTVDIAGLVKGASQGEGLGNAFLSHIRGVDGIIHVMRAFEDTDVLHTEDTVDPVRDIETICSELRIKDTEFMEKRKEKHMKEKQAYCTKSAQHKKKWEDELDCMERVLAWLGEGRDVCNGMDHWKGADYEFLNDYMLLSAKPRMFCINLSEDDYIRKKNKWLKPIMEWVQKNSPGSPVIPYSGAFETRLQELPDAAAVKAYCEEKKAHSVLNKIMLQGYSMVHLIYFYTAGPDEVRAWTIRKGYKAPQAAGVIHTDFERGFICAEVMAFDDLKELGSEGEVKAKGKYRQEGKTYEVKDGDIIFFKFNVTAPAKKK